MKVPGHPFPRQELAHYLFALSESAHAAERVGLRSDGSVAGRFSGTAFSDLVVSARKLLWQLNLSLLTVAQLILLQSIHTFL